MPRKGDEFTDRELALQAIQTLLAPKSGQRILAVDGVSGMGKTELLKHVRNHGNRHWRRLLIDVEGLVASFTCIPEGGESLSELLLRDITIQLAETAPRWRRRQVRRQARRLGQGSPRRAPRVQIWAFFGKVSNTPVNQSTTGMMTATERRAAWIDSLCEVAAATSRPCLLMVDTTEWLYYFDDVQRERPRVDQPYGTGCWFTGQVLTPLLSAAPKLKVVLAGQDRQALDHLSISHDHCELEKWEPRHTSAFLAKHGLDDPDLTDVVQEKCDGMPLLASLLIKAFQDESAAGGSRASAQWLIEQVRERSLKEWFPDQVLRRLTVEQVALVQACSVLRVVTKVALETLTADQQALSDGWFEALVRHCLLREIPAPKRAAQWRMHATIRSWFLAHFGCLDAERPSEHRELDRLHRRAASYYEQRDGGGFSLEAAYHLFACADDALYQPWLERLVGAVGDERLDEALSLCDIAAGADVTATVAEKLPAVCAAALHGQAHIAYLQGRISCASSPGEDAPRDRIDLAIELAISSYERAGDPAGQARMLQMRGQISWRRWDWQNAVLDWQKALDLPGGLTDPNDRAATLTALAETAVDRGDLCAADQLVTGNGHLKTKLSGSHSQGTSQVAYGMTGSEPQPTADNDPATRFPAVELATGVPPVGRDVHLLRMAAEIALHRSRWESAEQLLEQAEPRARTLGDRHLIANILRLKGQLDLARFKLGQAGILLGDAMSNACHPDSRCSCRIHILLAQARLAGRIADSGPPLPPGFDSAATSLRDRVAQEYGPTLRSDPASEARNRRDQQHRAIDTALLEARALGDPHAEAQALCAAGEYAGALTLYERLNSPLGKADSYRGLGDTARERGAHSFANDHYVEAARLYFTLGIPLGHASAHTGSGYSLLLQGCFKDAMGQLHKARRQSAEAGDLHAQAIADEGLGHTERERGHFREAKTHFYDALRLYQKLNDRHGQARVHEGLALTAVKQGNDDLISTERALAISLYEACGRAGKASTVRLQLSESAKSSSPEM